MKGYFLLAFLGLGGCATTYKPPEGMNTARMRMSAPNTGFAGYKGGAHVVWYPTGKCEGVPTNFASIGGFARLGEPEKMLGIPGAEEKAEFTYVERLVPSGQRLLFTANQAYSYSTCHISFSFVPETAADYEAQIVSEPGGCSLTMHRIRLDAQNKAVLIPEPTARKEPLCRNSWYH